MKSLSVLVADDEYPDLPVIIVTGHGDEALSNEVLELGAHSLLTKPFALRDLGKLVAATGKDDQS